MVTGKGQEGAPVENTRRLRREHAVAPAPNGHSTREDEKRNATEEIIRGFRFEDGTTLTERQHAHLFELAIEYLELLDLHMPSATALVKQSRIIALLTVYYWLDQHRVHRLSDVTPDHIALFAESIAFGSEWTVRAPHTLIKFLQRRCRESGHGRHQGPERALESRALYQHAKIRWPRSPRALQTCTKILRWCAKTGIAHDVNTPVEDLIEREGWKPQRRTVQHIHRSLLPLEELWLWKHHLRRRPLTFEPFAKGPMALAITYGKKPGRHPTIPPEIAFAYMRGALRWVTEWAPIIIDALRHKASPETIEIRLKAAGLNMEVVGGREAIAHRPNTIRLRSLPAMVACAAFVLIATLSARRASEILDLGAACALTGEDGHTWLRIYTAKTLREYDQIPVPEAIGEAIQRMEELSEDARRASATDSLWQYAEDRWSEPRPLHPRSQLNRLRHFMGSPTTDITWNFTAHQFRRFFAMLYFWRYEPGDVATLSHHLRHFDIEMTKRYVTGDLGPVWTDIQEEWKETILNKVVEGSRTVSGGAGERINKLIRRLRVHYREHAEVVPTQRIVKRLMRLARKWGAACRLHVWGTICVCPQKHNARFGKLAQCKGTSETGPVFSQATEETCATCPFAVHTAHFAEASRAAREAHRHTPDALSDGALVGEFIASSCERLDRALAKGNPTPMPPKHRTAPARQ